jgi:hypothetical protein
MQTTETQNVTHAKPNVTRHDTRGLFYRFISYLPFSHKMPSSSEIEQRVDAVLARSRQSMETLKVMHQETQATISESEKIIQQQKSNRLGS